MRFLDEAVITVRSGDGGRGCVSFRRERFIPKGGPDGGNGGRGGSVFVEGAARLHTLGDFSSKRFFNARRGGPGAGRNRTGKDGLDVVISVPLGTVIQDEDTGEILADLVQEGERIMIASGGRGGKGNSHFATSTRRSPRFAQPGLPGETRRLRLSLKHLAEIGIVGLPNAGKSTLLSRLTAATPETADYPFTTLTPNLGVLAYDDGEALTVADIPGIIEGASRGKGLGIRFLKHIERTRLLLHLVDAATGPSSHPPVEAYLSVRAEMGQYSTALLEKEQIVLLNKVDTLPAGRLPEVDEFRRSFEEKGLTCLAISALEGQGLNELKTVLRRKLIHEDREQEQRR
ncbi:MAG: GTPase ObgE [Thermodesulfobacteriota bacterium]